MASELLVAMIFPPVNAATPERVGNSEQIEMKRTNLSNIPSILVTFPMFHCVECHPKQTKPCSNRNWPQALHLLNSTFWGHFNDHMVIVELERDL